MSSLLRHHDLTAHRQHVAEMLGPIELVAGVTPSALSFGAVFQAFHDGKAMFTLHDFNLSSGILAKGKLGTMFWCCHEALVAQQRAPIRASVVLATMRDEPHGRLHVRFRAVNEAVNVTTGYLGQARGHSNDALSVCEATQSILRSFCTEYHDPPCEAAIRASWNSELYAHTTQILEAISVDSASNEITAANATSLMSLPQACQTCTPNCKHVLRDAVHSARKLLQRLWAADEAMRLCTRD